VNIDFEKLDLIEDRHAAGNDAVRALFQRYRERVLSAEQKRQAAVFHAHARFEAMSLARLACVPEEELTAERVDVVTLAKAFRDQKAAAELLAEHGRQAAAQQTAGTLLNSLRSFAGRK
jgi:hypothetical protein